ncbi:hypothetical protein [Richelia sinica]|nr:hypothetical protein [Richelia sinica]MBD2664184.1 hypothetical protein [Richelia sinica FACHB-800]
MPLPKKSQLMAKVTNWIFDQLVNAIAIKEPNTTIKGGLPNPLTLE